MNLLSQLKNDKLVVIARGIPTDILLRAAHDAGAEYIISPDTDPAVIAETKHLGMASIPGAMTPTEIKRAWSLGADVVKAFPADDVGMHFFDNLRGPLPHIPLMATGGVNPQTILEFLKRGVVAVGTGITILRPDLIRHPRLRGHSRPGYSTCKGVAVATELQAYSY